MNISKIGEQILEICSRKDSDARKDREELWELYDEIDRRQLSENEEHIDALFSLHRKLFEVRNRKASYWEHEIGRMLINHLPFAIRMKDEAFPEGEIETLKEHYDESENARPALKMSAKILKYAKEIIESKPDKTKRHKKKVTQALRWIDGLQNYYIIEDVKNIYMKFIHDKDEDLQLFALTGIENYFAHKSSEKITKEEVEIFENIIQTTKFRSNASTVCQILINAEEINQFGAVIRMDDWKDRNRS